MWYTTITAVHNIRSGAQYIHDTETFRLPEHQFASTVLIFSSRHFNISVLGVVVRGAKKHYVNVKLEKTLSTLQPRNQHCRSLGRTAQDLVLLTCKSFFLFHTHYISVPNDDIYSGSF